MSFALAVQLLFLEAWDDFLPWRDERHVRVSVATDASGSGWGGTILSPGPPQATSDYWSVEDFQRGIATKEALALNKFLFAYGDRLSNPWVDAMIDNEAVVFAGW